jgi:hypothetical protein
VSRFSRTVAGRFLKLQFRGKDTVLGVALESGVRWDVHTGEQQSVP